MKYLIFIMLSFLGMNSYAQHSPENHSKKMDDLSKATQQDTIKIAILLYKDVVLQDFAGPMEVFSKAKNLTKGKYKIFTVGLEPGEIVTENSLLKIRPDYSIENFPTADYIIVPGASMPAVYQLMHNEKLNFFIGKWNTDPNIKIVSICTASYLLANTGILEDRKATTHYFVADYFAEQYPRIQLIRDVRFVDEREIITTSGVTSGIDAALYIVGQHSGDMIQAMINRALQYNYNQNEKWPVPAKGMRYRGEGKKIKQ
ncbi:DJ-1/PfpI family protein [Flavobacterium aquidurense]|uniref:DJ-1/PfpI family protein n=1 Tax=Flavobacterium TaxID=237 RepID=UPI0037571BD8